MTMQPFDLERFKAGEPAYHKTHNFEYFFLAELPDGRIAVKYVDHDGWRCLWSSIAGMENLYYMKEKELTWDDVYNIWYNNKNDMAFINFYGWCKENLEPPKRKK